MSFLGTLILSLWVVSRGSLEDLWGELNLQSPKNQTVMVVAAASWCRFCEKELEFLAKKTQQDGNLKINDCQLKLWILSVDERPSGFYTLKNKFQNLRVIWDSQKKARQALNIEVVPTAFIIQNNDILWQHRGQGFWGQWPKDFRCPKNLD